MIDQKQLTSLLARDRLTITDPAPSLEDLITRYHRYLQDGPRTDSYQRNWWLRSYDLTQRILPVLPNHAVKVLKQRHALYGGRSLILGGPEGIAVRCLDKLCRLEYMQKNGMQDPDYDDKMEDNYVDLFNYAILGYLLVTGGIS